MTLVALKFQGAEFICCADTRISGSKPDGMGLTPLVDTFGKIFVVPIRCDVGTSPNDNNFIRSEICVAFAGGTLISSVIISLSTNMLSNLYSAETLKPPTFEEIVEAVRSVSECVFDEMKFKNDKPNFAFLVFGFCPRSSREKLFHVGLSFTPNGAIVVASQLETLDGEIHAIGTGRKALEATVSGLPKDSNFQVDLPSLVYRVVVEGLDEATGGSLTVAKATKEGVRLIPVMLPRSTGELETKIDLTISGLRSDRIGGVGEYSIGGTAIGAGMQLAQNNQWLERLGFNLSKTKISPLHRNLASLQYGLDYLPADDSAIDLRGKNFEVVKPEDCPKKRYYSCSCSNCHIITPLIEARAEARQGHPKNRPFRNGYISSICKHCNLLSCVPADNVFLNN